MSFVVLFLMEIYKASSEAIRRIFIYMRLSKSQEVKMSEKFQLKGVYANSSSDITITRLSEIWPFERKWNKYLSKRRK